MKEAMLRRIGLSTEERTFLRSIETGNAGPTTDVQRRRLFEIILKIGNRLDGYVTDSQRGGRW